MAKNIAQRRAAKALTSDAGFFAGFEEVIAELIDRKRRLYPFDRRWLLGLELLEGPDSYHVVVQSAIGQAT